MVCLIITDYKVINIPKKIFPAAMRRLFQGVYICMKCNARIRSSADKIKQGKVRCRKCGSSDLRLKAKERRGPAA
ncbi:hypothetical protein CL614_00610 [archaeon]|nr:hypothetical protein [archaeon]